MQIERYQIILIIPAFFLMGELWAQNAPLVMAGNEATFGNELVISISVADFNSIGSCNLKLTYDTSFAEADFVSIASGIPGILNFNVDTPGVISWGWFTYPALTLPDNSSIFTIHFSKLASGSSPLIWDDLNGYDCVWNDENYLGLNDIPTENYYNNGSLAFLSLNAPKVIAPVLSEFQGQNIEVPVTVSGFNLIGSFRLTLDYDPSVLQYQGLINNSGFPGLTMVENIGGKIKVEGYSGTAGINLADQSILFSFIFDFSGGSSTLNWYDDGTSCEFKNYPNFIVLDDIPIDSFYFGGSITERVSFQFKMFLEGAFQQTEMSTMLKDSGLLPLSQPYTSEPWSYSGAETVATIPEDVVDWILIELRQTSGSASEATSETAIGRRAGFLMKDGTLKNLDGMQKLDFTISTGGNLYAVVYHRNHLAVISSVAIGVFNGNGFYDFSTDEFKVLGGLDGHKQLAPGLWGLMGGDGNADGLINHEDIFGDWTANSGSQGYISADYNFDSQIENQDKNDIWEENIGAASQVPE